MESNLEPYLDGWKSDTTQEDQLTRASFAMMADELDSGPYSFWEDIPQHLRLVKTWAEELRG